MTRVLPSHRNSKPNLNHYKKEAKALLKACRSGSPDALARMAAHVPGAADDAASQPKGSLPELQLADAQLTVAREHGVASWPRFRAQVEALAQQAEAVALPTQQDPQQPPIGANPTRVEGSCSFCGKSAQQVSKLVAGPAVFICDECLQLTIEIVEADPRGDHLGDKGGDKAESLRAAVGNVFAILRRKAQARLRPLACSFCGRSQTQVEKLVAGPKVLICDACAHLARREMDGGSKPTPTPTST